MDSISEGSVTTKIFEKFAEVTFYHPSANALPSRLLAKLAKALRDAGDDATVHSVILRSAGDGAFCAGANFDELLAVDNEVEGKAFFSGFAGVILAIRNCPVPVLGRIHGKCVGGGVGLAAACDYALATPAAMVKLSELAIGIGAYVIGPAVKRKTGVGAFAEISLRPDKWFDAAWARNNHLFAELVEQEELDNRVEQIAGYWGSLQHSALINWKKELWLDTAGWETLLFDNAAKSGSLLLAPETRKILQGMKKR